MKRGWIAVCLAAAGCSIMALSDEISQSECLDDEDCDVLNRRDDEDFDACRIWQCGSSRRCELSPLDVDHDGALPRLCVKSGQAPDCADNDPEARPGLAEKCDGKDNDCDIAIDEGMLAVEHSEAVRWSEPPRELDFAWNPISAELGVAYSFGDDQRAGFAVARPGRSGTSGPLKLAGSFEPLRGTNLSTGIRVGRFITTVTVAESPHRTWVGYVNGVLEGFSLSVESERLEQQGLSCTEAEACDTGEPSANFPASTGAELSTLESQVLLSRTRQPDPAAVSCEEPRAEPAVLNMLFDNFAQLLERTDNALELDRTIGASPPALLAIDASEIRSATEQFGWLTAYPNADGELVVRRIKPDVDDLLGSTLRLRIERGRAPFSHVQLELGSITDNRVEIGLAVQEGCGEDARVLFGVLQLTWDLTGRTELRVYRELGLLAGEDIRSEQPVLAWNRMEVSWGIAYLTGDGIFARVLDGNGVPRGDQYSIRESLPSLRELAIVPFNNEPSLGLFGVYSYVDATDAQPQPTLDVGSLRACEREGDP